MMTHGIVRMYEAKNTGNDIRKKILKRNFHDGIKYIFCGKFLHSPNFFEKWIFKLVVVLVHIIL